jgi:hypothetical protein
MRIGSATGFSISVIQNGRDPEGQRIVTDTQFDGNDINILLNSIAIDMNSVSNITVLLFFTDSSHDLS